VDLLTNDYAFEIEWAHKWKNAIGQSLWYGIQSNKKPGIILILKDKKDYKYFIQLNSTLKHANLENSIKVFLYPNDFKHLMNNK